MIFIRNLCIYLIYQEAQEEDLMLLHNEILSEISLQNGDFPALNSCKWKTRHLHVDFPHFEVIVFSREVNIVSLSEQKRMSPHVKIGLLITYFCS